MVRPRANEAQWAAARQQRVRPVFTYPTAAVLPSPWRDQGGRGPAGSAALLGDRGGGGLGGFRVQVAAAGDGGPELVVEVVDQRYAGGDVQTRDVRVADPVQVLHQGPQRVAVSHDERRLARRDAAQDHVLPVRS